MPSDPRPADSGTPPDPPPPEHLPLYQRDLVSRQEVGLILAAFTVSFVVLVVLLLYMGQVTW